MKILTTLTFILIAQLSFANSHSKRTVCAMSYDNLKTVEAELEDARTKLSNLEGLNYTQAGASVFNLAATAYVLKTMHASGPGEYVPFILYAAYTSVASYTTYVINKEDVQNGKEILPLLEKQVADAITLHNQGCDPVIAQNDEETIIVNELYKTIELLKATQLEINKALKGQPTSNLIKFSGLGAVTLGLLSMSKGGSNIGGGILVFLGGIVNAVGDTIAMGAALIDRGELEKHGENLETQIIQLNELLTSLNQLRGLKQKYK